MRIAGEPGNRFIYGHNRRGVVLPVSTRAKQRAAKLGKSGELSNSFGTRRPTETKAKQRAAKLGGTLTPEHREHIGAAVRGDKHPNWQGGRKLSTDRYVNVWVVPSHPLFSMAARHKNGSFYIREHRLVMAESIGRPLTRGEVVHHKLACEGGSGDTKDNRIENLRLFPSQAEHLAHHAALRRAVNAQAALADLQKQSGETG
jgi:HNH endonuclease